VLASVYRYGCGCRYYFDGESVPVVLVPTCLVRGSYVECGGESELAFAKAVLFFRKRHFCLWRFLNWSATWQQHVVVHGGAPGVTPQMHAGENECRRPGSAPRASGDANSFAKI